MPNPRPCLGCGRITRRGSYCDREECGKPTDRARRVDRKLRTACVQAFKANSPSRLERNMTEPSYLCPGWGRDPHWVLGSVLTADHIHPGVPATSCADLQVLCRSCNGRKSDRRGSGIMRPHG